MLGLAIEAVTGKPLAAFLDERVFTPLGMHDYGLRRAAAKRARFAKGLPLRPGDRQAAALRDGTKPHKFDCGGGCAVRRRQTIFASRRCC